MMMWMGLVFGALLVIGVRYDLMPSSSATHAWRCSFGLRCFSCIIASLFVQQGEFWHDCRICHIDMI